MGIGTIASKGNRLAKQSDRAVGVFTKTINELEVANAGLLKVVDDAEVKVSHYVQVRKNALDKYSENNSTISKLQSLVK